MSGDDPTFTGYDADLGVIETPMDEKFTREVEGRLGGDAKSLQEAKLLNCISMWTPSSVLREADLRRAEQLLRGLFKSESLGVRGVSCPGHRREVAAEE
eukprot:8157322-Alexandrium_andersonii.AAC.1